MNFRLTTVQCTFQWNANGDFAVLATRWPGPRSEHSLEQSTAAASESAQNFVEIDATKQILGREAGHAGNAMRIVFGSLLRIAQDRIGLGNLFEPVGSRRVLISVGMVFQGKLTERVLDRFSDGLIAFFSGSETCT